MSDAFLSALFDGLRPWLPLLVPLFVACFVLAAPLPGRGPKMFQRRDPWRGFKYAARRAVFDRAGGRCEAPFLLFWGRCMETATDADHIYPWSRGGPTVLSNGQALCRSHNRRKTNMRPPWWYVLGLERRRARYVPTGQEVRVLARMSEADRLARIKR